MLILRGRIIDGTGNRPLEKGVVILEGNKIKGIFNGQEYSVPENTEVMEIEDGTILPGFIDCHTHLCSTGMDMVMVYANPNYDLLIGGVADCKALIEAGFTSIREISEFGPYLKRSIDKGIIPGPRMQVSGRILSITGGHGDLYPHFPVDFSQGHNPLGYLVDGVDECIKGARLQFREGADFIKICSTGGVMSLDDSCEASQFSMEELRAIVSEAERHNTYVASHAHGANGIRDALKAGVKSIEHGTYLSEECIDLMVNKNAFLVPTLSILKLIVSNPGLIPEYAYKKGVSAAEAHLASIQAARKAGIKIVLGSDFLGGTSSLTPYGKNGIEFASLVEAGLTPMEAIMAGTKQASRLMGWDSTLGTLETDKLADIVMVKGDPLKDINLLTEPGNIKIVMKDGKILKNII